MELITINWKGGARKVKRNGRDYLVAPLTMLVPGVLNGSQGPLLYPDDEVELSTDQWNGMPIVLNHPTVNGVPVSARDPDLLETYGIGTVYRSVFNQKLVAEGWFDVLNTQRVDSRVLEWLDSNTPFELSTGLFTKNEPAPENSVLVTTNSKGQKVSKPYQWIARSYRPDHLAVLPDATGACSLDDGCGVLVNAAGQKVRVPRKARKRLLLELVRTLWGDGKAGKGAGTEPAATDPHDPKSLTANALSHDQIRGLLSQALRASRSQADPYCYVEYVYDDYFVYEDRNTLYRQDYTTSDTGVTLQGTPVQVVRELNFLPANNEEQPPAVEETDTMPLSAAQRGELITHITTNCSCWKDGKSDLEKLSDGQLQKLKEATPAAGAPAPAVPAVNATTPPQTQPVPAPVVNADPRLDQLAITVNTLAETVKTMMSREQAFQEQTKQSLVGLLTSKVTDEQAKAAKVAVYNQMPVEHLAFLAREQGLQAAPTAPAYWGGAAGGMPPAVTADQPIEEELLETPVINWGGDQDDEDEDESAARRRRRRASA